MAKYMHADVDQYQMVSLNYGELFSEGHPTRKLFEIINKLDLSDFDNNYANDKKGRPAFPVDRLLAVLIYSLLHGNISMRNLERDLHQRADLLFLSGGLSIEHSSISVFRKRHAKAIEKLFTQTVFLGNEGGVIDFDAVCIDSTKIKANANRRDIGTSKELEKRYEYVKESCQKRYKEWEQSEDEEEKAFLAKKQARLKKQEMRISRGLEFLKENPERKRIHLTDPDADWQKNGSKGFVVGYNVQMAVDAGNGMIVEQKVTTEQADSVQTVPMVEGVEEMKANASPDKQEDTKYILDAGYASEENLTKLQDKDVYMPDKELASQMKNKTKPEDRQAAKKNDHPDLEFIYNKAEDTYTCPSGEELVFKREKNLDGIPYRAYRQSTKICKSCLLKEACVTKNGVREIWVASSDYKNIEKKYIPDKRSGRKGVISARPLTVRMREKLKSWEGKRTYALRLPVAEGNIGVIKEIRQAAKFWRRGIERVQTEWTERCIAHNLAKIMEFRRV